MPENTFDVVIIGSAPGGYVCAIRAAQLGLKTAIVEKDPHLGGTCLNVGCIPSKALLHSSELYYEASHGESHGLSFQGLKPDLAKLMERKDKAVGQLRQGVNALLSKRKVEIFSGRGELAGEGKVTVHGEQGVQTIQSSNIVIASGSAPVELPFLKFDGKQVVSSDDAIAFDKIPEKLIVVGGGAIGLEIASVWSRLGTQVTIVEFLPTIAAGSDEDISKIAERAFKKQGMKIDTKTKVTEADVQEGKVTLKAEKKGKEVTYEADKVLVSVGRKPVTEGLGLETAGVKTLDNGRIATEHFKTSTDGIWAIGDVIEGPMLAHKSEEDGVAVAEMIAGKPAHVNYDLVPNVIYTAPEIASVGINERIAKERNIEYKVGSFPLKANGRAIAQDTTDGVVKVLADAHTDQLLGASIVAAGASEIIASVVAHMEYGGSAEDVARTIHAHPTISESIKEAALAVEGRSIHSL